MINSNMRIYDYYTLRTANEYGQRVLQEDAQPAGKVKMSISVSSQSIQDNILYQGCEFIGLTHDTEIKDDYVIQYGKERLKVLYISPETAHNRFKQVFLTRMG